MMRSHAHSDEFQIELIIAASGSCVLGEREITISNHLLMMIPAGVPHSFRASGSKSMRHFTIKFRASPEVFRELPAMSLKSHDHGFCQRVGDQMRTVIEERQLRPWGFEQTTAQRVATIILEAVRTSLQPEDKDQVRGLIDKACKYMAVNHGRSLSVMEVADHCDLRTDSLCRLFRKHLRTSPGRYLQDLRIQHAKALLRSGYTVTECASRSGFSSIHYFSRLFRATEGTSPKVWAIKSLSGSSPAPHKAQ